MQLFAEITADNVLDILETAVTHYSKLTDLVLWKMRCNWREWSKRKDFKEKLSSTQWTELEQSQYPPLTYYKAIEDWKKEGAVVG